MIQCSERGPNLLLQSQDTQSDTLLLSLNSHDAVIVLRTAFTTKNLFDLVIFQRLYKIITRELTA